MVVLGVIVLIVVAVVAVTVVYQGGDEVILELPGFTVDTTGAGVFVGGVVCTLLGVLGIVLVLGGARRGQRRRKEVKQLRKEADKSHAGDSTPTDGHSDGAGELNEVRGADYAAGRVPPPDQEEPAPRSGRRGSWDRSGRRWRDDGEQQHFSTVPRD
jgi:hypothetical protein